MVLLLVIRIFTILCSFLLIVLFLYLFTFFIFSLDLFHSYFCICFLFLSLLLTLSLAFLLFVYFSLLSISSPHLHSTHPLQTLFVLFFRTFFVSTPSTGPPCFSLLVSPSLRPCSDMDSSPRYHTSVMLGPHHVIVRPILCQC